MVKTKLIGGQSDIISTYTDSYVGQTFDGLNTMELHGYHTQ